VEDRFPEEGRAAPDGDGRRQQGPLGHCRAAAQDLPVDLPLAVVTGASSGLGAELVRALRSRGWFVIGVSRRPSEADEHVTCDVSDRAAVSAAAADILERHLRIDLLVNNAGVPARSNFLDGTPERIEQVMAVNYFGSVWTTLSLLEALGAGSHVVNVVSVAGTFAAGPYSASKHAQLAFSRSIAVELAARKVSVHTVNPGFVETPGFEQRRRLGPLLSRLVVDPPFVVRRILEAIEHDKREIFVPRWYRAAAIAQALAPGLTARLRSR
jgi:NAD(P)-dependent dehydrogenase (short-subunit alcohol dehydrogenase family)